MTPAQPLAFTLKRGTADTMHVMRGETDVSGPMSLHDAMKLLTRLNEPYRAEPKQTRFSAMRNAR